MFFNKKKENQDNNSYIIKITALLIHAAKIDEKYSSEEEEIIKKTLLDLGSNQNELENIIKKAKQSEENANQILDFTREIKNLQENIDECPLGSGALVGTNFYEIDRFSLAKSLGFKKPSENSIDSVSDRDFVIEFFLVTFNSTLRKSNSVFSFLGSFKTISSNNSISFKKGFNFSRLSILTPVFFNKLFKLSWGKIS